MPIREVSRYCRQDLQGEPDVLFVFGDNMDRRGFGGQAKECRGEPNAIGIPTKWSPSMDPSAFFSDSDFPYVRSEILSGFHILADHLRRGGAIVLPKDGLGTGLAKLPTCAPKIHFFIERATARLHEIDAEIGREVPIIAEP